jgi:hypothetical protein
MIVPVEAGKRLYPLEMPSLAAYLLDMPGPVETERDITPLRDIEL